MSFVDGSHDPESFVDENDGPAPSSFVDGAVPEPPAGGGPDVARSAGADRDGAPDVALSARADGWLAIGLTAVPADRAAAEAGVREAYALAGLAAPEIVWRGSPLAGALAAHALAGTGAL